LEPDKKIRLPLSSTRRSQIAYTKLLQRIDPRSRSPFEWHGRLFRSGTWIHESELWPDGTYPRTPLLVEHAGAENPLRGWNRHKSDNTVVLWRYERVGSTFVEVGRVAAPAGMWAALLEPLVRDALARDGGGGMPVDLDGIRERITRVISAELDLVSDADRGRVLTLVHDELASRIAEWYPMECWAVWGHRCRLAWSEGTRLSPVAKKGLAKIPLEDDY
jgi:hypothetical protein